MYFDDDGDRDSPGARKAVDDFSPGHATSLIVDGLARSALLIKWPAAPGGDARQAVQRVAEVALPHLPRAGDLSAQPLALALSGDGTLGAGRHVALDARPGRIRTGLSVPPLCPPWRPELAPAGLLLALGRATPVGRRPLCREGWTCSAMGLKREHPLFSEWLGLHE